jgi:hypothetical protein
LAWPDRCLDRRPSLLACPSGFGTSTLVASWTAARSTAEDIGVVSVDEGDNDPVVWWALVSAAPPRGIRPALVDTPRTGGCVHPVVRPLSRHPLPDHQHRGATDEQNHPAD